MSNFLYRFFLTILFFSLLTKVEGQVYNFSNYTVETGLSQPQILAVFQDDDGVMWFGTNGGGITKFDGNSYEYFTDKDGLADNLIYCITKDKKGRILIGTNNGLSVYDPFTSNGTDSTHFKNYTTKNGLSNNRIYTIFIDKNGEILLGTGKGISVFQDSVCSVFNIDETLNNALIFNMSEDSKQNLWLSTLGNGAFKYDGKTIKNYTSKDGFENNFVYSVLEFDAKTFWFLTNEGLFALKDNEIKQIYPPNLASTVTYYSYLKDKENNIWIACKNGLLKYNGKDFQLFTQKNGLVNDNIWKIFQDKEKNLWFASKENGISKLANERFFMYTLKDGLLFNQISRIFQSKDGKYWIGSPKGLSMYDGKNFTNYNQKDRRGNDAITAISEDRKGNYLIGTGFGVLKYDGKSFERIESLDNKNLNYCHDIFIDSKGEIWLGTNGGIAKVIGGKIKEFDKVGFPKNFVFKIHEDISGNYWFATDDGLYKYDGLIVKHFTENDGFVGKRVNNIVNDKEGNLLFATSSGIAKYSKGKFSRITEKEGLSSNDIQSIAIDNKGDIWVGLQNGINKIMSRDNEIYEIRHFAKEDGFIGQACFFNAILIDQQEKIWFGTENGLVVFQPKFDRINTFEPITRLKSINLFSQKTDWKLFADSLDKNNLPVNLELAHNKNYLTFNFIGVSLTTPGKVKYRFMLKGLDKDWLPETSETEAPYSNIPPGEYEFLVMANNGEGVWNKVPVSYKFIIHPPFWQTWWFYSIIGGIVLIFIYSYVEIKSANNKILKQSKIIADKNVDLKQAYAVIADKNKSITDSINYAQRIQQSFLSSEATLNKTLKNYFILYKPRDIVSGDFYWAFDLPDRVIVACADSTGHGIPGAFMSLIGISLLNEISHSKNIVEPAKILDELRRIIICALNPEQVDSGGKDGMDISLISIFKNQDSDDVKIHFSGANNAIYIISGENNMANFMEFKSDKQPVGFYSNMKPFSYQEIILKKGDIIYMGTDGFADQFGGTKGKKFMSKQLKKKLTSIHSLPLKEQEIILENAFEDWKGDLEQVDDVTVMGIRI
ncbi:MAG: two-component regulator propeller domain-containing protein [Bacteroidia bacterium]|nr:two-component regulator propeller domain-containing protein [Bacteroidia bacterium]